MRARNQVSTARMAIRPESSRMMGSKWEVAARPNCVASLTALQISITNDMVALPTFMAESLSKAKGSWGHSAAQAVKGAAYTSAKLVSQEKS